MSKVSFEDIGNVTATFFVDETVEAGDAVKVTADDTVGICGMGETFIGVLGPIRKGVAPVQVGGFMQVKYSGYLNKGYTLLVSDGYGGVQATDVAGVPAQVIQVRMDGTAVIYL